MKIFLFILLVAYSMNALSQNDAASAGQLLDEKGKTYNFGTTVQINKGEVKELTVTGLYNGFYSKLNCKLTVIEACSSIAAHADGNPSNSAYIFISNINNKSSSTQTDFQCGAYGGPTSNKSGCRMRYGSTPWNLCKNNRTEFPEISPGNVVNGDSFKIINRPEFDLELTCLAD